MGKNKHRNMAKIIGAPNRSRSTLFDRYDYFGKLIFGRDEQFGKMLN